MRHPVDVGFRLKQLNAAPWADLVAAGEAANRVEVHSLEGRELVASFDTVLDFGGRRLAVTTGEDPVVVVGSWDRQEVCGYSLTGEVLWQQTDHARVQQIELVDHDQVAVSYEGRPAVVIDARDGKTISTLRGVQEVIALRPGESLQVERHCWRRVDDAGPRHEPVEFSGFLHDAAVGEGDVLAVADGPLRLFDPSGVVFAEHGAGAGRVVQVHWMESTRTWLALQADGGKGSHVLRLDENAEVVERAPVAPHLQSIGVSTGGFVLAAKTGLVLVSGETLCAEPLTVEPDQQS